MEYLQEKKQVLPGGSSQERVLAVLQSIGSHGSATLGSIAESLQIPRSSSHRAVQALMDFGWVQKRSGDQAYVLSTQFSEQVGVSEFGMRTAEAFRNLMAELRSREYLHSEVSLPDAHGSMRVIESTSKNSYQRREENELTRFIANTIPEIRDQYRPANIVKYGHSLLRHEKRPAISMLAFGLHLSGDAIGIPFKTEWSEVGVFSIWPVRRFSNSAAQLERISRHLRCGEIFELPEKTQLFYTGEPI